MQCHYLQLHPSKTEIIMFENRYVFENRDVHNNMNIHGTFITPDLCIRFVPVVENLGFRLDAELFFQKQISTLKQYYLLRLQNISRMSTFLVRNK